MANQFNAVSLNEGTYPHPTGVNTVSGVFPNEVNTNLVAAAGASAALSDFDPEKPVDESVTRRPQPSVSGVFGIGATSLTTAYDSGTDTTTVGTASPVVVGRTLDHLDAPFFLGSGIITGWPST